MEADHSPKIFGLANLVLVQEEEAFSSFLILTKSTLSHKSLV